MDFEECLTAASQTQPGQRLVRILLGGLELDRPEFDEKTAYAFAVPSIEERRR